MVPAARARRTRAARQGWWRKRKFLPHGSPCGRGATRCAPACRASSSPATVARERQATREALSLLDSVSDFVLLRFTMLVLWPACSVSPFLCRGRGDARTHAPQVFVALLSSQPGQVEFYEDLVDGKGSNEKPEGIPDKPLNKKIKFADSDSSDDDDDEHSEEEADNGNGNDVEKGETAPAEQQQEAHDPSSVPASKEDEEQAGTAEEPKEKKQRVEDPPVSEQTEQKEIADEPKESTDKPKESINKPKESSERNIDDLIDEDLKEIGDRKKVISALTLQFAVLYEARSNTGIDRMKIINAVAKSVPQPHKVDLKNPDKTIIVQIAKVNVLFAAQLD
ncbi:hypothetical protein HU200_002498 [Digitaria exilis]|uniref:THUMP domain-containing protein n=1 Tax=Digitaria exilis TaxID=1010633 RepID=A0A835FYH7_9POAL|nr:hypothetical protein HU200_002498 [Digitaria exilis]